MNRPGRRHPGRHLTTEEIAAYLERRLEASERARVQAHMAACPTCRHEVGQAWRLLDRRSRGRWWKLGFPAAAAAVLVGLVLSGGSADGPESGGAPSFRTAAEASRAEGVGRVAVVEPPDRAEIVSVGPRFVWRGAGDEAFYTFVLAREDGRPVWSVETSDTALALPDSVRLESGSVYLWYVDALLADGTSASTGIRRVGARPSRVSP